MSPGGSGGSVASSAAPAPAPPQRRVRIPVGRRDQPATAVERVGHPSCLGQADKDASADAQSGRDQRFCRQEGPLTGPKTGKGGVGQVNTLPIESRASCDDKDGQSVEEQTRQSNDVSPASVALSLWKAPSQSQACILTYDNPPWDRPVRILCPGSDNRDEAHNPGRIRVGSVDLPLPAGGDALLRAGQDNSPHLLSRDRLPSICSPIDSEAELSSAFLGASFEVDAGSADPVTLLSHTNNELLMITLSDHSLPATCPASKGGSPCTPCNGCNLDVLRSELAKAVTPILSRLPTKDPVATKQRPRTKRQPVSNPRRSVRIARGVGRGSNASK